MMASSRDTTSAHQKLRSGTRATMGVFTNFINATDDMHPRHLLGESNDHWWIFEILAQLERNLLSLWNCALALGERTCGEKSSIEVNEIDAFLTVLETAGVGGQT